MRRIARFLRLPRSASRVRADVNAELQFEIDMHARELMQQGMSARDAHERACREFGDIEATRRYCEDIDMQIESEVRRSNRIEDLRSDVLIALRGMRRSPLFTAVVLLTLGIGIGANTAVFSVVRRVLIAPLPFREPSELYRLYTAPSATSGDHDKLSAVELEALAAESRSIVGLTFFGNYSSTSYSDNRSADLWQAVSVDRRFFDVLGIRPVAGRVFQAGDFERGAPRAVMITHQLWQRAFAGDRGAIGRVVQLDGRAVTIVGVLPEEFVGPTFNADVLRPLDNIALLREQQFARSRVWRSIIRLKSGISQQQLEGELALLQTRLQTMYPEIKNAGVFLPTRLHDAMVGGVAPVIRLVMAGALIVLLAACMNIAGLFLSRTAARRRELGVRVALGAARERLVLQVLVETILYGIAGGALGIVMAVFLKAALLQIVGPMLPKLGDVTIDASVLAFSFAASIFAGVTFGVLPALAATRVDVRDALGDGGTRSASHGIASSRASRLVAATQVAFAAVLIVGASLFVRTFKVLVDTKLGYETTEKQVTFFLNLGARYQNPGVQSEFAEAFVDRVHAIPGVTAVGYTVSPPWSGPWRTVSFAITGQDVVAERPSVVLATASAQFLPATGMAVLAGRGFNATDRPGSTPVVVVSESMARRYWPNANPIGARLRLGNFTGISRDTLVERVVIGVVNDVRQGAISEPVPTLYVSSEQSQTYVGTFVVRADREATTLLPSIKAIAHSLDPMVSVVSPKGLREVLGTLVRRQNVAMVLIGMFAVMALLLAALGVYGVVAYGVASRVREFGIRSALGAPRASIIGLVFRQGLTINVIGLGAGLVVAAGLPDVVASLLVGVAPRDPVSFTAAAGLLTAAVMVACIIPARLATSVSAVEALRSD